MPLCKTLVPKLWALALQGAAETSWGSRGILAKNPPPHGMYRIAALTGRHSWWSRRSVELPVKKAGSNSCKAIPRVMKAHEVVAWQGSLPLKTDFIQYFFVWRTKYGNFPQTELSWDHYRPQSGMKIWPTDKAFLQVPMEEGGVAAGNRAFSKVAPNWWNSLPFHLWTVPSLQAFYWGLKTLLFR